MMQITLLEMSEFSPYNDNNTAYELSYVIFGRRDKVIGDRVTNV